MRQSHGARCVAERCVRMLVVQLVVTALYRLAKQIQDQSASLA